VEGWEFAIPGKEAKEDAGVLKSGPLYWLMDDLSDDGG